MLRPSGEEIVDRFDGVGLRDRGRLVLELAVDADRDDGAVGEQVETGLRAHPLNDTGAPGRGFRWTRLGDIWMLGPEGVERSRWRDDSRRPCRDEPTKPLPQDPGPTEPIIAPHVPVANLSTAPLDPVGAGARSRDPAARARSCGRRSLGRIAGRSCVIVTLSIWHKAPTPAYQRSDAETRPRPSRRSVGGTSVTSARPDTARTRAHDSAEPTDPPDPDRPAVRRVAP